MFDLKVDFGETDNFVCFWAFSELLVNGDFYCFARGKGWKMPTRKFPVEILFYPKKKGQEYPFDKEAKKVVIEPIKVGADACLYEFDTKFLKSANLKMKDDALYIEVRLDDEGEYEVIDFYVDGLKEAIAEAKSGTPEVDDGREEREERGEEDCFQRFFESASP